MKIWVADGEKGLMLGGEGEWRRIAPPCRALCAGGEHIYCACQERGLCLDRASGRQLFDFPLPGGVCAMTRMGESICALSSDADNISAFCPRTGELLFSAPAGVFPRDLCKSPCGKYLAVAGGAAGEMLIFDRQLECVQKKRVPGSLCALCFLSRGMAALCAAGDHELSAHLMLISPRGVMEEVYSCADAPCSLCAAAGGKCLVGCHGEVAVLREDGRLLYRLPFAFPARMLPLGQGAAVCDGWQGEIRNLKGKILYQGAEPCDFLISP